jgi:hypothetical protein
MFEQLEETDVVPLDIPTTVLDSINDPGAMRDHCMDVCYRWYQLIGDLPVVDSEGSMSSLGTHSRSLSSRKPLADTYASRVICQFLFTPSFICELSR